MTIFNSLRTAAFDQYIYDSESVVINIIERGAIRVFAVEAASEDNPHNIYYVENDSGETVIVKPEEITGIVIEPRVPTHLFARLRHQDTYVEILNALVRKTLKDNQRIG